MPSNFDFIQNADPSFRGFYNSLKEAEEHVYRSPRLSAVTARICLENGVRWIYDHDDSLNLPYQDTLSALIYEHDFKVNMPEILFSKINFIRKLGNQAAHNKIAPGPEPCLASVQNLYFFFKWMVILYSEKHPYIIAFNEKHIPVAEKADKTLAEIQKLERNYRNQQKELDRKNRELLEKDSKLRQLQLRFEETRKIKAEGHDKAFHADFTSGAISERKTRELFVDLLLREAGWDPKAPDTEEYEVAGMPLSVNPTGKGYVDYVLWGNDGLPLAVVEVKKTIIDSHKGQHQAELYANCLEQMKGQRPVIFYTNGYDHYLWDDNNYPPRKVEGFYTHDELQLMINRRKTRKALDTITVNKKIAGRYYQEEAIRRVTEDLTAKRRGALLVMATGSGKTRTAAALVDILTRANWVKNVLFLADRNALVTQAKNAFKEHLPHLNGIDLTKEKEDHLTRLVFSTYPTIMNKIDSIKTADQRFYTPGHFDLIIIDEAHRSVYMKYQAIFSYFDSMLIGLTATPKAEVDKNTYELFGLETHNPTYAYELDKAVTDGFLNPPKALGVPLKFPRDGIKYKDLSEEDKQQYELTFRDEETGFMPEEIESGAFYSWLFNKNTVDKILAYLMENGLKVEGGNKPGKTIIFAASHKHALFIEECFNKMYPEFHGKYLRIIDNYEKKAQSLLDDFSTAEKYPLIAVSVDMLDTGIDIHEILNLVFFKRVRSSAKFWQMIGRGTRLCENLFGPGLDKKYFIIFDFCENFEFFEEFPEGINATNKLSLSQALYNLRLKLTVSLNEPEFSEYSDYRNTLLDVLHREVSGFNRDSFMVRQSLRYVDKYSVREKWDDLNATDIIEIKEHITPLVMSTTEDELAQRFDLITLKLQLALIEKRENPETHIHKIMQIGRKLAKKSNIPIVHQHMETIKEIISGEFWARITIKRVEEIRKDLRDLIKLIDKENQEVVYTDITDEFGEDVKETDILKIGKFTEGYKMRVEKFIRDHQDMLTIKKLKHNMPITANELEALEKILFDGDKMGTREDFEKEYGRQPLGVFIRSIVGLDTKAAREAFAEFLSESNLTANQIRFIDNIIDYLSKNGIIDKAMLFESTFTEIDDQGLSGVFNHYEINKIFYEYQQSLT